MLGLAALAVTLRDRRPGWEPSRSTSASRGSPTPHRPIDLPLLLAWLAVPVVVAGLAIVDGQIAPLALPLEGDRVVVIAVAFVTLVGARPRGIRPRRPPPRGRLPRDRRRRPRSCSGSRRWIPPPGDPPACGSWRWRPRRRRSSPGRPSPRTGSRRAASRTSRGGSVARRSWRPGSSSPRSRRSGCPGWVAFEARIALARLAVDAALGRGAGARGLPDPADLPSPPGPRGRPGHEQGRPGRARADRPPTRRAASRC